MKRLILASAALVAFTAAGPAVAADMWVKAPYHVPWSWTGLYVGANAGYSWGRSRSDATFTSEVTGAIFATVSDTLKLNGGLVGLQAGYNWQVDRVVFGIETDIQGTGERGSASFPCPTLCSPNGPVTATLDQRLRWFGTLRGRLGVTGSPIMAYLTGGLA